jgi:predicted aldo/keto reductase-like oxidoreductase
MVHDNGEVPMTQRWRPTRREFIQIALAGAIVNPARALAHGGEEPEPQRELVRRTLGRTGLELPIVSMGSCYAINLVQAALDRGVVHFHSSGGYADGEHERLLGKALRPFPRNSFVVGTCADVPYRMGKGGGPSLDIGTGVDPKKFVESLDDSLRRLRLDYLDIYYLGSVGTRDPLFHEPYVEVFDQLKRSGKTRFVGITTHSNEPVVIRAAAASKFWDIVLTAFNFRQSHREDVRAAIREAASAGLGVVAMKTQAGVYWDRSRKRRINMKAALKWVLQDENVHTSIPAFMNFEEMEEDLSVMENPVLTKQEKRDLELGDEMGFSGNYCQQCGECLPHCPSHVDIPLLMRSHMYALAHKQPAKARRTLSGWSAHDVACITCNNCVVDCALGLDIRSRSSEIARLLEVPGELLG